MPNPMLIDIADKSGMKLEVIENKWEQAKGIASEDMGVPISDFEQKEWAYAKGVLTTMLGIKEQDNKAKLFQKFLESKDRADKFIESELKESMPVFKVTYDNGSIVTTSMASGLTLDDAKAYFLGKQFNLGSGPNDRMATAIKVEQLKEDRVKESKGFPIGSKIKIGAMSYAIVTGSPIGDLQPVRNINDDGTDNPNGIGTMIPFNDPIIKLVREDAQVSGSLGNIVNSPTGINKSKDLEIKESQLKEDYKLNVFNFLDHPWQEDNEIAIIDMISEYKNNFKTSIDFNIKSYLKNFYKANSSAFMRTTDAFQNAYEKLIESKIKESNSVELFFSNFGNKALKDREKVEDYFRKIGYPYKFVSDHILSVPKGEEDIAITDIKKNITPYVSILNESVNPLYAQAYNYLVANGEASFVSKYKGEFTDEVLDSMISSYAVGKCYKGWESLQFRLGRGLEESDPSLKAPKGWWDKMKGEGKSDELVGSIWAGLSDEKKSEIRGREGKTYGPAPKKESVLKEGIDKDSNDYKQGYKDFDPDKDPDVSKRKNRNYMAGWFHAEEKQAQYKESILKEEDSNLVINWRNASPSDRSSYEKLGLKGKDIQVAYVEQGNEEIEYVKVDGKKYRINGDIVIEEAVDGDVMATSDVPYDKIEESEEPESFLKNKNDRGAALRDIANGGDAEEYLVDPNDKGAFLRAVYGPELKGMYGHFKTLKNESLYSKVKVEESFFDYSKGDQMDLEKTYWEKDGWEISIGYLPGLNPPKWEVNLRKPTYPYFGTVNTTSSESAALKYAELLKNEVIKNELKESLYSKVKEKFGVFRKGGSIGNKNNEENPVAEFDNEDDAKQKAKRLNALLSPGEKTYYGIKYYVKNLEESLYSKETQQVLESVLKEGIEDSITDKNGTVQGNWVKEDKNSTGFYIIDSKENHVDGPFNSKDKADAKLRKGIKNKVYTDSYTTQFINFDKKDEAIDGDVNPSTDVPFRKNGSEVVEDTTPPLRSTDLKQDPPRELDDLDSKIEEVAKWMKDNKINMKK